MISQSSVSLARAWGGDDVFGEGGLKASVKRLSSFAFFSAFR